MSEIAIDKVDGEYEVWLNTGIANCDGLCIGEGVDRRAALESALRELRQRTAELEDLRAEAEQP